MDRLASFFSWALATSAMATVLILLILLARFVLKDKLKPRWSYLLWTLLVLRLILPWTPESSISVFNMLRFDNNDMSLLGVTPHKTVHPIPSGMSTDQSTTVQPAGAVKEERLEIDSPANQSAESRLPVIPWLSLVWLTGAVTMLGFMITSSVRFALRLKREPAIRGETVQGLLEQCKSTMRIRRPVGLVKSDRVSTPTLFGVFRPVILMQESVMNVLNASQLRHVFLHELAHIKRNDIAMNWLMNVLLAVHWFNPLIWYAYRKMRSDQEMACDALALSRMKPEETQEYGLTIIRLLESCSNSVRLAGAAGVSGRNRNIELKRRVAMIASYKKSSWKFSLPGLAVILLISGCALTGAKSIDPQQGTTITEAGGGKSSAVKPSALHPDFPVPQDAVLTKGEAGNPNIKKYARYNWKEADEISSIAEHYLKEIEAAGWIEKKDEQMGALRVFEKNGTVMWVTTHNGFFTVSELHNELPAQSNARADESTVDDSALREAAWASLLGHDVKEVKGDWKAAIVEKADMKELPIVQSGGATPQVDHLYKVTFHTYRDEMLGPIEVFMNGDTNEVVSRNVRK